MSDRLLTSLRAIIRALAPSLAYYAVWEYRVVSVDTSTPPITISANPTGASPFGPQSKITLWPGPTGSVAVPQVGSLVRLQFADGSGTKPMLVGLDPSAPPAMVFVGSVAGEFAALASRVAQLQTAYNIHIHPAGSPNTGVPTVTSAVNFASSKVQVAP